MIPGLPFLVAGLVQVPAPAPPPRPVPSLPAGLALPAELEVKPGSVTVFDFDRETFDTRPERDRPVVSVPVSGRTWRFLVRAVGARPMGAITLLERMLAGLEGSGWTMLWRDRGVLRRGEGERQLWLKVGAGSSGELKAVLVERGQPRILDLPQPGPQPELPKGTEDFPYLPPWPRAKLIASNVSQSPVDVKLADGTERIQLVNFLDKEYRLPSPPSNYEFLVVYREALERAGWTIEGTMRGATTQLQATFLRHGRDLRATLRLFGDAMGISVADVGAQLPPAAPKKP